MNLHHVISSAIVPTFELKQGNFWRHERLLVVTF